MGRMVITFLFLALLQSAVRCNDCKDDEKIDCVMLTSMFNICNVNIENAAKLCRQTCNLCYYPNGNWAEWSSWSACTVTCGNQSQTRTRTCTNPPPENHGKDCEGSNEDYKQCVLGPCPVDGNWTEWSSWSTCSVTCGSATQSRIRTCTNPPPSHNGAECEGLSEDYTSCVHESCRGWGHWSEWGSCSSTCGVGLQHRNRSCYTPIYTSIDDLCVGDYTEVQICMPGACADCTNPPPTPFGRTCTGPSSDVAPCNTQLCPQTDGRWAPWSSWNTCSVTCGGGFQQRARDCTNPPPSPYGRWCTGPSSDVEPCNTQLCPQTAGGWSDWSSWSSCTAWCGGGNRQRYRGCTNPLPYPFGQPCIGQSVDVGSCNTFECGHFYIQVRLVSGRLEIFLNGQWGTVCDDRFEDNSNGAKVACRMLGLPTINAHYIDPPDGPYSMLILLDDVVCHGHENSLLECNHIPYTGGEHYIDCNHSEDVGVSCG